MGIKVSVRKQELYPVGEYLVRITGSEATQQGKVKVRFTIADGPFIGRPLSRNYNPTISAQSELGKLFQTCGINTEALQNGQQLDLDAINGAPLYVALTHFQTPNGFINSVSPTRSAQGGVIPQAVPVAPAPVAAPVAPAVAAPSMVAPVPTTVPQPQVARPPVAGQPGGQINF